MLCVCGDNIDDCANVIIIVGDGSRGGDSCCYLCSNFVSIAFVFPLKHL